MQLWTVTVSKKSFRTKTGKTQLTRNCINFTSFFLHPDEPQIFGPFVIIGSVLLVSGAMFLFFATEICNRLKKNAARVRDPEIDKLRNLHEVKHWVDPGEQ